MNEKKKKMKRNSFNKVCIVRVEVVCVLVAFY